MDSTLPLLLLLFLLHLLPLTTSQTTTTTASCPLNFTILQKFLTTTTKATFSSTPTATKCQYTLQGLHLVQANHLLTTSLFLPPPNSSTSCWLSLENLFSNLQTTFDPRRDCGFSTGWISQGCMNITTRAQFESVVPSSALDDVRSSCNQSLANNAACASCTTSLGQVSAGYLTDQYSGNNVTDCASYPAIYAAGVVNPFGPLDDDTALCLFFLGSESSSSSSSSSSSWNWVYGVVAAAVVVVLLLVAVGVGVFIGIRKRKVRRRNKEKGNSVSVLQLESICDRTGLVRYTFEEIKVATRNFCRDSIVGSGGYSNVYRGVLRDGTQVAVKRFKNCSAVGDESFAHELEVIASVRHVNLVALRGFCIANSQLEGHQRIIICDLIKNGSLHDHLFGRPVVVEGRKLTWPVRQKIAVGTARGLAYLHHGAQPAIIHRDVKATNVLLDEEFEPKVADFGLAKFTPVGASHLSTRVAGTYGYVSPEYALYGKLTDKSDVYSFGVLLLELLSGRKAMVSVSGNDTLLVTDWAWSLVKEGRVSDTLEEGMEEAGPKELLEKYVLIAVLCSHPHMHVRPAMDLVLKYMESNLEVPAIPDRPISLISDMVDIDRSVSSSGSGQLSSSVGYQPFAMGNDQSSTS